MGETITAGDVQRTYNRMMEYLDKSQWKTYPDPITPQKISITEEMRKNIKTSASHAVTEFKSSLNLYLATLGIK